MNSYGFTLDSLILTNPSKYDFKPQDLQGIVALVGTTIFFFYCIFPYLGSLPFTIFRYLWDALVYIIPSRIIAALDAKNKDSNTIYANLHEKKQAMQRVVGFDRASLDSILPRGRRLSSLGNALLGSKELIPPGLGNWDNSCYQNSVIQGLASLRSFADYLKDNIQNLDTRGPLSTHHALTDIIERLNDPGNHGQKLWIPSELKSMSSWQQQDAQEYFSKIADQLDREVREASKKFTTNSGFRMFDRDEKFVEQSVEQPSLTHNPLEGLLAQRVGCIQCGWTEGLSLIPFNCLTVSLGRKSEYDIRECLDDYMALETIEGVECAKCTLLRAQDQLNRIIQQIEGDKDLTNEPQMVNISSTLKDSAQARLQTVQEVLEEEDFTEKVLTKKCHIPPKNRVSATKSRQAVIARTPRNLVFHVNRSVFDENTGSLRKNYADVRFPASMDLDEWCLGTRSLSKRPDSPEVWDVDPQVSMLPLPEETNGILSRKYELQAVLTHFGRHENGHYICFRKFSSKDFPVSVPEDMNEKEMSHQWFRLSDEDVRMVSEQTVFNQGGVFMLFYERIDETEPDWQDSFEEPQEKDVSMEDEQMMTSQEYTRSKSSRESSQMSDVTYVENEGSSAESKSSNSGTSDTSLDSEILSARLNQHSDTLDIPDEQEIVKNQEIPNDHIVET